MKYFLYALWLRFVVGVVPVMYYSVMESVLLKLSELTTLFISELSWCKGKRSVLLSAFFLPMLAVLLVLLGPLVFGP